MTAAAKWSGGLRGRWIAWLDCWELQKLQCKVGRKVISLWTARDSVKKLRVINKLFAHAEGCGKMRRMVGRWKNQALSNGFRSWLIDYAFARAGRMLRHSAIYTRLGRGFTRFKEASAQDPICPSPRECRNQCTSDANRVVCVQQAFAASLLRYQHGKFAAAAQLVLAHEVAASVVAWRRWAIGRMLLAAWSVRAGSHRVAAQFYRFHANCTKAAASSALSALALRASRRSRFVKLFYNYRCLSAPGGTWQLRNVSDACALAYRTRKGLARWQQYCFHMLCLACAVQHDRIRRARVTLHGWQMVVFRTVEKRTARRVIVDSKMKARLLMAVLRAWRDAARLKLLSMPSHLYSLANAWGAGAVHWRLVELREAERYAAQAMAHHAAAMERARTYGRSKPGHRYFSC